MFKKIKIKNYKKLSKDKKIDIYNKPKFVYIPLIIGTFKDITILVKKGEKVFKGSYLGKTKGKYKMPIISSVSGIVVDFVSKPYINGELVKCVKIENDFKEKSVQVEKIDKITHEDFVDLLKYNGIIGMGGTGIPTYLKYDTDLKIKTLIVDAVESEPFITSDYEIIKNYSEEILECIDMIQEIEKIDEAIIAISENEVELLKTLNNYIGTYLNIKIVTVEDFYPSGWERFLIKNILNVTYDESPIEKGIVVNNVATIYAIHEVLKKNKPLTERIVTFSGDMFLDPKNVMVKIGTEASEVIDKLVGYNSDSKINFIAGGPMMGTSMKTDDVIITANLNGIVVSKDSNDRETNCIRCGKCASVCPYGLCPLFIRENLNNNKKLKKYMPEKCIECGLCSYICPSKIPVMDFVKEAKKNNVERQDYEQNS